jgi:GNAT superfamily N-acetyltransferase
MHDATHIEIRRAVAENAVAIAKVLYESFVEFKSLYTEGGFAATALGVEQVLVRMQEGPVWVAVRNSAVVGTVAAIVEDASVYIRGMAVLPSVRGSGAGAKLLAHVEEWARAEARTRLYLSTTPFLAAAIRLYEKFGFRRTEDILHDLFGTPLFTMEKMLSAGICDPT